MSTPDRRALVDRDHGRLSIRRQCGLLGLAHSGIYRRPRSANDNELGLMRRIDELFTAWPFLGSRRMVAMLRADVHRVQRQVIALRWRDFHGFALQKGKVLSAVAVHKCRSGRARAWRRFFQVWFS